MDSNLSCASETSSCNSKPGCSGRTSAGSTAASPPQGSESHTATGGENYSNPKLFDPKWQYEGLPDTEFYRNYPPDAWGEEASSDARVWKIYRDEMTKTEKTRLESWNKMLDVLLIFAGLFSAVSTAFIMESYKALQPDYTQYVAHFLYTAAASSNLTVTGGTMRLSLVDAIASPDSFLEPSSLQRWTNGVWFSSLVISLSVAFLTILIKQWLDEYHGHIADSAAASRQWARRHQFYSRGLQAWGVPVLISFLPLLLHIALFLFLSGLVLFLQPLDGAIAYSILATVALLLLFYVHSLVMPAWYMDCPSYTPLLAQARSESEVFFGLRMLLHPTNLPSRCFPDQASASGRVRLFLKVISVIRTASNTAAVYLQILLDRGKMRLSERQTDALDAQWFDLGISFCPPATIYQERMPDSFKDTMCNVLS